MKIVSIVKAAREKYEEATGTSPTILLINPMDFARAEIEAWERAELGGRYGMPNKLSKICDLEVMEDHCVAEGTLIVVREQELEEIVSKRLMEWRRKNMNE